ncbi:O-antigen ligase family protein [Flavobacteriaceae bacterium]|nr:O-antigen ligase family protein [Flavobacteriaceae bacterium]
MPSLFLFFHSSVEAVQTREYLLGYEPSYSTPLTVIFLIIYKTLCKNNKLFFGFSLFTIYALIFSASRTAFIIFMFFPIIYIFTNVFKFNFVNSISFIFLLIFIPLIVFNDLIFTYINTYAGLDDFAFMERIDQYEIISLVTRLESIQFSIEFFKNNYFGIGIGNSIIILSNYLYQNSISFEILESNNNFSLSPKSQFLEYLLSGGIVFFVLLVYQLKKIIKIINNIISNSYFFVALFSTLLVFIIGERLPYILLFSLIYFTSIYNTKRFHNEK